MVILCEMLSLLTVEVDKYILSLTVLLHELYSAPRLSLPTLQGYGAGLPRHQLFRVLFCSFDISFMLKLLDFVGDRHSFLLLLLLVKTKEIQFISNVWRLQLLHTCWGLK